MISVRCRGAGEARKFGPKTSDHPTIGKECPACGEPFVAGDHTSLVALGPGSDSEEREKAREGRFYNAVAVEVHWACASGFTEDMPSS